MKTIWTFNDGDAEKERIQTYWAKKQSRIERLLKTYREDLKELWMTIYWHPKRKEWEARAVLHLPTGTIATQETRRSIEEALDILADELVRQIKRHRDQVRKDFVYRRRRQTRMDLSAAGPYIHNDVMEDRRESFLSLMRPLMRDVYDHARRELIILETQGSIPQNEYTAGDLLDEVLAQAWEEYKQKPEELELDVWLLNILHRKLAELVRSHKGEVSTNETVEGTRDDPYTPDSDVDRVAFWLERIFADNRDLTLGELIPDPESTAWMEAVAEEDIDATVRSALSRLPSDERQALMLHELAGYEDADIANILGVKQEDVPGLIEAAKAKLRDNLSALAVQS